MNKESLIKVGFLLSYDYDFLRTSIPLVYKESDIIVLAKDYQCRAWTGVKFTISKDFFDWLKKIDIENKIKIYEDNFYFPDLSIPDSETKERNMLAAYLGKDTGWHIQLDADEYFLHFKEFTEFLKSKSNFLKHPQQKPVNFACNFHVLFKKINSGYLYVKGKPEIYRLATNNPEYIYGRKTKGVELSTDFDIVHHTWAREPDEVRMKLDNWTHTNDFDTTNFLRLWESIDEHNYEKFTDLHPLIPGFWPSLGLIQGEELLDVMKKATDISEKRKGGIAVWLKRKYWIKKMFTR